VFDLVRRWPAPAEEGAAIRLPWLTDSLRDAFTKLASDVSREYATPKLRAEIMIERGFAASPGIDRTKEKPPLVKSGGFVKEFWLYPLTNCYSLLAVS
jgi:hypothetical protein